MSNIPVTTTIPLELFNLAREKCIPWNEALIKGIKLMVSEEMPEIAGEEIIQESYKCKLEKVQRTMQQTIDELNQRLEAKK